VAGGVQDRGVARASTECAGASAQPRRPRQFCQSSFGRYAQQSRQIRRSSRRAVLIDTELDSAAMTITRLMNNCHQSRVVSFVTYGCRKSRSDWLSAHSYERALEACPSVSTWILRARSTFLARARISRRMAWLP